MATNQVRPLKAGIEMAETKPDTAKPASAPERPKNVEGEVTIKTANINPEREDFRVRAEAAFALEMTDKYGAKPKTVTFVGVSRHHVGTSATYKFTGEY